MYSIWPFVFILLSLAAIVVVIVRKFPQLTLLDVDSIPEVKAGKKKDEYLKKKVDKQAKEFDKLREKVVKPLIQKLKEVQLSFRKYVGEVQKKVMEQAEKDAKKTGKKSKQNLKALIREGEQAMSDEDLDAAEKKFIEAVRINPKNKQAYFGLGKVYHKQGEYADAVEALEFLLTLDPEDDAVLVELAEVAEDRGDTAKAIEYYEKSVLVEDGKATRFIKLAELMEKLGKHEPALEAVQQAVELEPQNPKYLDKLVEISVECGNKDLAEQAYKELRMVNPENKKLEK